MRAHRRLALAVVAAVVGTSFAPAARAFDRGADGEFDQRTSAHFELWQDVAIDQTGGFHGSRRFEQAVLADLERAYDRLDDLLGLRPDRRIEVVVYDPAVFDAMFAGAFRFSAAGVYNGVIRIRGATALTVALSRILHHELVHAALDAAAPSLRLPGWLNEGLAEWFEARAQGKRGLNVAEFDTLERAHDAGGLFALAGLSTFNFGHLGPDAARLAYLQSYAMVAFLAQRGGEDSLRELCDGLLRTRDLDRTLTRVYRDDLGRLESRFLAQFS